MIKPKHLPFPKGKYKQGLWRGKGETQRERDHGKYQIEFPLALLLN